jgi:hypothetical protein
MHESSQSAAAERAGGGQRLPRPWVDRITAGWCGACVLAVVVNVAARSAYFRIPHLPAALNRAAGSVLSVSAASVIGIFTGLLTLASPVLAFTVLWFVRRSWCLDRSAARVELRAPWLCVAWTLLVLGEFVFDFNRYVSGVAWLSLPLAAGWLLFEHGLRPRWRPWGAAAWCLMMVIAAGTASNALDAMGVLVWGAWVLILRFVVSSKVRRRDLALLLSLGIPGAQIVVASPVIFALMLVLAWTALMWAAMRWLGRPRSRVLRIPSIVSMLLVGAAIVGGLDKHGVLTFHGGRPLAEGLAYSYCEMPERHRIFAAVPVCPQAETRCEDAAIIEYPIADWSQAIRHPLFQPGGFWGRIEHLTCVANRVEVALCCTKSGRYDDEATLTWSPDAPESYLLHAPEATGRRSVFDEAHHAIFYLGEHVWRVDLATGAHSDVLEKNLLAASERRGPPAGRKRLFLAERAALDSARDSLFVSEFNVDSDVFEVDLGSLEVRQVFHPRGGVTGVAVDREAQQIWTASMYGVEIFDIGSGRLVTRWRTGTLPRTPVIDYAHDLVYVPTTIGGRIEVFDRRTPARLGEIPIGIETRLAFLSDDGRWFLATASTWQYVWDADRLAGRFGRARPNLR